MHQHGIVLFDLDGTLLDTAPDFAVVVNQLRARHHLPALDFATIRQTVSHGARALVTLAFQYTEKDPEFESLREQLLSLYEQHLAVYSCLFNGLDDTLAWLESEQIPWGIVTNKPRRFSEPLIEQLQLHQRCAVLVCPDDVTRTKPDPEPLLLACARLQRPAEGSVYIGDHRRDIEAGRHAGMTTVAAGYGYIDPTDPASAWQADHCIERPQQLRPLLSRLWRHHTKHPVTEAF